MQSTRRGFLGQLGAAGLVSFGGLPPSFLCRAALASERGSTPPADGRVLILVELAGGNDGLNTVIPYGDDAYYRARPGIAIGQGAVHKIDDYLGLHPQMRGFKELYDEGMLAIVQGVGYEDPNRSHFRSMDIWHSAIADREDTRSGWLGRALDDNVEQFSGRLPAVALGTNRLPLALLASKVNVPTVRTLEAYRLELSGGSPADRTRRIELLREASEMPTAEGSQLEFLRRTALGAMTSAETLRTVTASYRSTAPYPNSGLGQRLKTIAQAIAGELGARIYFVSLGGFDTHSQQAGSQQALLGELASAVRAFYVDLQGQGLADRVLLATFSEFGRRVEENGSLGTDHGAASQVFVVTPTGKGGVIGKHPSLTDLVQGDLKYHTDFRRVYATLLDRWLELPSEPVFGRRYEPLDFA